MTLLFIWELVEEGGFKQIEAFVNVVRFKSF